MTFLVALLALFAIALLYQAVSTWRDRRRYPAPGSVFDIGCGRLHLHRRGTGQPVVVLESGIAASSLSWTLVQSKVAEFTQVCSYDRAGLGWSTRCTQPRTVEQMVEELHLLLSRAQAPPPYVLAGHSFGGLLIRAYAHFHPSEVSGLVFVDPVSLEYWAKCGNEELARLRAGARLSRRGALLADCGVVRVSLALLASGRRFVPKLLARLTARRAGSETSERIAGEMRHLPPETLPPIRSNWSRSASFRAMAAYLEGLPNNAKAALAMPIPEHVPFIVLSAGNATDAELSERDSWAARAKDKAWHIRVEQSGHWLQLEKPDAVVRAIEELVELARNSSLLNSLAGRR